jgi:hypothetical protein
MIIIKFLYTDDFKCHITFGRFENLMKTNPPYMIIIPTNHLFVIYGTSD